MSIYLKLEEIVTVGEVGNFIFEQLLQALKALCSIMMTGLKAFMSILHMKNNKIKW